MSTKLTNEQIAAALGLARLGNTLIDKATFDKLVKSLQVTLETVLDE